MANNKWGQGIWGENAWGDQADTIIAVSSAGSLSTSIGTEVADGEVNEGWGRLTWNENAWGVAGDVFASGQSLALSQGSATVAFGSSDSPTGQNLTASVGTLAGIEIGTDVAVTGQALSSTLGSAHDTAGDANVSVTGSSLTSTAGSTTIDPEFLIEVGWGRGTWGNRVWGGAYSALAQGQSMTSSIGSVSVQVDHVINQTGLNLLTITQGLESITIDGNVTVFVGEDAMNLSLGQQTLEQSTNESVTGQALAGSLGTVVPEPKIPVDVTGISASMSLGSITLIQTTVESVTGQLATFAMGTATQASIYPVTTAGSLATSIGSVVATGTASTPVSGIGLTTNIGSTNVTAWSEIDPGVNNVWTEVDKAA